MKGICNFGGIQSSCCDSDRSSIVVFLAGCPYKCNFCQNASLNLTKNYLSLDTITKRIKRESKFASEIIFSGGEPFYQIESLIELARFTKNLGLKVGIETSGFDSMNALELFNNSLIDFIYLDFKTSPEKYEEVTGYTNAFRDVYNLMRLCQIHKVSCEIRTTNVPGIVDADIIKEIENVADEFGFKFKLQQYRGT